MKNYYYPVETFNNNCCFWCYDCSFLSNNCKIPECDIDKVTYSLRFGDCVQSSSLACGVYGWILNYKTKFQPLWIKLMDAPIWTHFSPWIWMNILEKWLYWIKATDTIYNSKAIGTLVTEFASGNIKLPVQPLLHQSDFLYCVLVVWAKIEVRKFQLKVNFFSTSQVRYSGELYIHSILSVSAFVNIYFQEIEQNSLSILTLIIIYTSAFAKISLTNFLYFMNQFPVK